MLAHVLSKAIFVASVCHRTRGITLCAPEAVFNRNTIHWIDQHGSWSHERRLEQRTRAQQYLLRYQLIQLTLNLTSLHQAQASVVFASEVRQKLFECVEHTNATLYTIQQMVSLVHEYGVLVENSVGYTAIQGYHKSAV